MPHRYLNIVRLSVGDRAVALGHGTLAVSRDDPEPGIAGLKAWHFSAVLSEPDWSLSPGTLAVELVTELGTHTGTAILRRTDGTSLDFIGTGPLEPWPPLFD